MTVCDGFGPVFARHSCLSDLSELHNGKAGAVVFCHQVLLKKSRSLKRLKMSIGRDLITFYNATQL